MDIEFDFSRVNLQYLIQFRDIAKQNPELAAAVFGLPAELVKLLAEVSLESLVSLTSIKAPLFIPRTEPWWWSRLLIALKDARAHEVDTVIEHANLAVLDTVVGGGKQ